MQNEKAAPLVVGVYFNDGCVRRNGYIYVAAKLQGVDPDEYEFSRTFNYNSYDSRVGGPRWGHDDLPGLDVVSVCHFSVAAASEEAGWNGARLVALSTRGTVVFGAKGIAGVQEVIADMEDIGAGSQIRQISDRLYVCGMQGQVYRRDDQGWVHIDAGILDVETSPDALHLNGIDGTSHSDIYVAGFRGRILHFDGRQWSDLVSPTNVHLERVHCVSPDEVYFCGNRGTFLKLAKGVFSDHSIDIDDHFWGLTSFQGKIYLATLKGIYEFDGTQVRPVDTKLDPPIGGYRLDASSEQLWSFGVDDLAWFDGTSWKRLSHPDNP